MHRLAPIIICIAACDADPATSDATTPTADVTIDTSEGRALTRHDVSVLFPLRDGLWKASDPALGGVLLPRAQFEAIGRSVTNGLGEGDEYDGLRVVAVRFDDCFRVELDDPCQPQIRLVLQFPDAAAPGSALDGAVHALYNVDDLATIAAELKTIALLAPENVADAPLGVSPALSAQGLGGAYGAALKDLVTRHAGQQNLARMTFMTRTDARAGQWQFGGFHIGTWPNFPQPGAIGIVGAFANLQTVTRQLGPSSYHYELEPMFADLGAGAANDGEALAGLAASGRASVHDWAVRQEDPSAHTADTTDCASCHLAPRVSRYLESLDATLLTPDLQERRGPRVIGAAEDNGDNLRAFGWFADAPHVSQRTANETEGVVAGLNGI